MLSGEVLGEDLDAREAVASPGGLRSALDARVYLRHGENARWRLLSLGGHPPAVGARPRRRRPRLEGGATVGAMREILPGVHHWETLHPQIQVFVSSYWLEDGGVLLDPLIPEDVGIDWFANRPHEPGTVILTNRHHLRESVIFRETFGCPILCNSAGL